MDIPGTIPTYGRSSYAQSEGDKLDSRFGSLIETRHKKKSP